MLTDADILRDFVATRSDAAFRELVRRYAPLVYSAALRQVRHPDAAQDIAQIVFALLARKARHLSSRVILSGWLYRATYFVASRAQRAEWRRQKLEQEAAHMHTSEPSPDWLQLA